MCINYIDHIFLSIYSIVSESGASIYSVSDAAQKEMPDLDPSLRGAGKYILPFPLM